MSATRLNSPIAVREGAIETSSVIPPPEKVRRLTFQSGEGPGQWVHYTAHPDYGCFKLGLRERVAALSTFTAYFGFVLVKRLVLYERIPAHLRASRGLPLLKSALANIVARPRSADLTLSPRATPVLEALCSDGVCVSSIPRELFDAINLAARPLFDQLRLRRGERAAGGRSFEESRASALRTAHAALFEAVERMLASSGIIHAVSGYVCRPARLIDVNPQINDTSDDFWQNIFPDRAEEERPARYFHKDASGGDIKAILYMSDVGVDAGPFSYAIGSHKANEPALANWIEETNDQSGLSGTDAKTRRRFMALPAQLRRKCAVGNDLLAGGEFTERLLASEWVITAPQAHIVVFDTKGLHRGGMVAEGERAVITCVLG
jgi:hypothetical protein